MESEFQNQNSLVGEKFTINEIEYIITWNYAFDLRATPTTCETGLTSIDFKLDEIELIPESERTTMNQKEREFGGDL